jgi:hypothetical protein
MIGKTARPIPKPYLKRDIPQILNYFARGLIGVISPMIATGIKTSEKQNYQLGSSILAVPILISYALTILRKPAKWIMWHYPIAGVNIPL